MSIPRRGVPHLPGCATPTEIVAAEHVGVEFAKVVPGEIPGPAFVVPSQESQP